MAMLRVTFSLGSHEAGTLFAEHLISFPGASGTSPTIKQRNVAYLHRAIIERFPHARILEVSTKSDKPLGVSLSAFNLRATQELGNPSVEGLFQAGKVFEYGGPFKDISSMEPADAKRDPRLKSSGKLIRFESLDGKFFQTNGRSDFYDFLYLKALLNRQDLLRAASAYDTFTDIEFSKNKIGFVAGQPFNCQARSIAMAVSLFRSGGVEAVATRVKELEAGRTAPVIAPNDNYLFDL
jgi:hypothetical protein